MGFEATNEKINSVFSKVVFSIPRNQRKYVWNKENWSELFEDITTSCNITNNPHFIGSIVLKDDGKKNGLSCYTIIDGQQRITTIIISITAIIRLFKEHSMKDEFEGTLQYIFSKDNINQAHPIMSSTDNVAISDLINRSIDWDCDMVGNAFINTVIPCKKDKKYKDSYTFFYEELSKYLDNKDNINEEILKIRDKLLDVNLIRIVADTDEDSYTVFEILNARGQELEDYELLKNYIMRYIVPIENRDKAKIKWETIENLLGKNIKSFIMHYATHKYGAEKNEKSPYRIIQRATKGKDINALLDDIVLKANYYSKFIAPECEGENPNCSVQEEKVFSFFKLKRAQQFRPVLMSIIHNRDLEKITESKYIEFLNYLYNFFICFTIIGKEKSNRLADVIYKYAAILENNFSEDNMNEFAQKIKTKIPSEDWFLNAFKNVGWSNHVDIYKGKENKDIARLVIKLIEEYTSQSNIDDEFTIEHVLPDSDSTEHNCQIGNLIPLEESLNSRCKDKPLYEKISIYDESKYRNARGIKDRIQDGIFEPDKRTEYLSKLIYNNILSLNQLDFSLD